MTLEETCLMDNKR